MRATIGRKIINDLPVFVFMALLSLFAAQLSARAVGVAQKPHNYRDKNFDYFVSGDPTVISWPH